MKRGYILFLTIIMILPLTVSATSGALRKNSLKTCPNGITYGMHGDGNGGTHWHEAVTNGKNYYAKGDAIYSDPCPNSNTNAGTAKSTEEKSNNNSSNNNSYSSSQSSSDSNQISIPKTESKSNDNTIKEITIDSNKIDVKDEMNYETTKKNVEVIIVLNDSKARYNFNNKPLVIGENIFVIRVFAEDESAKDYKLTIIKQKAKGKATINKFVLNSEEVHFEKNKATVEKPKSEKNFDYIYELNNPNATLKIFLNGTETKELKGIKENDIIKLVVIDEDDNENQYKITVKDSSLLVSLVAYGIIVMVLLSPVIAIVAIIIIINKRKQSKSSKS